MEGEAHREQQQPDERQAQVSEPQPHPIAPPGGKHNKEKSRKKKRKPGGGDVRQRHVLRMEDDHPRCRTRIHCKGVLCKRGDGLKNRRCNVLNVGCASCTAPRAKVRSKEKPDEDAAQDMRRDAVR
mgnify:FL=1